MEIFNFIVLILGLVVAACILAQVARLAKDAPDRAELARLRTRDTDYAAAQERLQEKDRAIESLQGEKARLAAALEAEQRGAAEKIKLLQEAEARLKTEFENLANRIFEDKGRVLTEQNRERLGGLLQPFKEQLETFRRRVDEVHSKDTEQAAKLLEQVRQLHEASNRVSDQANSLAMAIRGDSKRQGDWGELIIERIFEASGLERGREYDTQVALRAEDGSLKKPDFVVYLPGDKAVIVDAKMSLTAYERFFAAKDEAAAAQALNEHVRSVRRHVEELGAKDYGALLGSRTLDFVLMCIPLEPAYQAAFQADRNLLYELAGTKVVVTGPATLMITLKLIAQIWRRENENRNVERIAEGAGKIYDQVSLVVEAMQDAQKRLKSVDDAFSLAMNRLSAGRGNLVGRVETLRKLGAKVSRDIPAAILEAAAGEAEVPEGNS